MPQPNNPAAGVENNGKDPLDQIVEDGAGGQGTGDDNKQEGQDNPFKAELDRLNGEIAKKDEIISHKNRAIDALKKKNEETTTPPAVTPPSATDELVEVNGVFYKKQDAEAIKALASQAVTPEIDTRLKQLEDQIIGSKIDQVIDSMTQDVHEKELIKFHLNNTIKASGDVMEDIKRARLLANETVIFNDGKNAGLEAKREDFLTQFTPSASSSKGGSKKFEDPALQLAADMLTQAGLGDAVKHLQK